MRRTSPTTPGRLRILMIHREFPSLTKTFHYREFAALREHRDLELSSFAFRPPARCPEEAKPLRVGLCLIGIISPVVYQYPCA